MSYTKNIAVIRGIKDGFSADGGALSGLVKAEKYGKNLRVEVSYINFAPLSEGKYVCALTDGKNTQIVDNGLFSGESVVDTGGGFAALISYVRGGVFPIASAVCGSFHEELLKLKAATERAENLKSATENAGVAGNKAAEKSEPAYEDEAIAEVNYYEYAEAYAHGGAVCADKEEKEDGREADGNEAAFGAVEKEQPRIENEFAERVEPDDKMTAGEREINAAQISEAEESRGNNGRGNVGASADAGGGNNGTGKNSSVKGEKTGGKKFNPLGSGIFYERMKDEIDGILAKYPAEKSLEEMIDESKWVRITYGEGGFYVFGVLFADGNPKYICYGVPTKQSETPPESMEGLATFLPASPEDGKSGFWVMYQDAATGASVKVKEV